MPSRPRPPGKRAPRPNARPGARPRARSDARPASEAPAGTGGEGSGKGGGRSGAGRIRLIGGEWRGRRLAVADVAGLRPSGDRVRETLFNWLQPFVGGARCLDLFAGSGALGLEAASRGAAEVVLVERDASAAAALRAAIDTLGASGRVSLVHGTAERWLDADGSPFDIVFVDPPFDDACQASVLARLARGHLAEGARVYVESPRDQRFEAPPDGLVVHRERVFGDVAVRLLRVASAAP